MNSSGAAASIRFVPSAALISLPSIVRLQFTHKTSVIFFIETGRGDTETRGKTKQYPLVLYTNRLAVLIAFIN